MSEQASIHVGQTGPPGPRADPGTMPDGTGQPLRALGLAAVCLGVAALAAATFVLSYSGIHAVARQAGISPRYASDYPLLIDAMLVIALMAVLGLRGAGIPSRILAWLTLLAVLAAAAGADALHATGHALRHNVGAATAAVLPWALVLLAFVLLLALLRHARLRRHASVARRQQAAPGNGQGRPDGGQQVVARPTPLPVRVPQQWNSAPDSASIVPSLSSRLVSSAAAGAAAAALAESSTPTAEAGVSSETGTDDTEPASAAEATAEIGTEAEPADHVGARPAGPPRLGPSPDTGTASGTAADMAPDDTEAVPGDADAVPDADGGEPGGTDAEPAGPGGRATADEEAAASDPPGPDVEAGELAPLGQDTDDAAADDMPVFHRMWSTPTPPDS